MKSLGVVKREVGGAILYASGDKVGLITKCDGRGFTLEMKGVFWRHDIPNFGRGGSIAVRCVTLKDAVAKAKEVLANLDEVQELRTKVKDLKKIKLPEKKLADPNKAADDIKKGLGLPPYDGAMNPCVGDGYFHKAFEREHGMPLMEAAKILGLDKKYEEFEQEKNRLRNRFI